jgi:hypothetical protein
MDVLKILRFQWDRVSAWAAIAAGALTLVLGWVGASREVLPAAQIPYIISGGLGGVFLLGLGAVLLFSADLRDEWRQLREMNVRLGEPLYSGAARPSPDRSGASGVGTTDDGSIAASASRGVRPARKTTRARRAR